MATVDVNTLDNFTKAYLSTALWTATDETGESLDGLYTVDDFGPEAIKTAVDECYDFMAYAGQLLETARQEGQSDDQLGHDFSLSRNGHGAGFFDNGTSVANRLQASAKAFGEAHVYACESNWLHFA